MRVVVMFLMVFYSAFSGLQQMINCGWIICECHEHKNTVKSFIINDLNEDTEMPLKRFENGIKSADSIPYKSINNIEKLSPKLKDEQLKVNTNTIWKVLVVRGKEKEVLDWLSNKFTLHNSEITREGIITFNCNDLFMEEILTHPSIVFLDGQSIHPQEELILENIDFSVNGVNILHNRWPELQGENFGVSVKEEKMDTNDLDLLGKYVFTGEESEFVANHSTTMSTIIGGIGNSYFKGRGVAPEVKLASSDFRDLLPDEIESLPSYIRTQNHSYGTEIENYYGIEAMSYDEQINVHQDMIHVFSAGNSGEDFGANGTYEGIQGFANLTGNYKQAKNILTIGAVDLYLSVESRSSRGPAFDGRVKPELVAYGEDGSSGAAALTSGVCVLLQEYYFENFGIFPDQSLLRAILIASGEDIEQPGPDFISGYGLLRADQAMEILRSNQYRHGETTGMDTITFDIALEEGLSLVRIALSWIDPPAIAGASTSLINDLDMKILHSSTGEVYLPWKLSTQSNVDSLSKNAVKGEDHINNNELIAIENPLSGSYQIIVYARSDLDQEQAFDVAFHYRKKDDVAWEFPTSSDTLIGGETQFLRWESTYDNDFPANLYVKKLSISEWEWIDEVDLSLGYYEWTSPSNMEAYQCMIEVNDQQFISDTFLISPEIILKAGTLCNDELMLEWEGITEALGYNIFLLENNKMTHKITSPNPYINLNINEYPTNYFAVAPILPEGNSGLRSRTINLAFQNPVCYVRSFNATEDMGKGIISLMLSSVVGVETVILSYLNGDVFLPIETYNNLEELLLSTVFDLNPGENIFQYSIK